MNKLCVFDGRTVGLALALTVTVAVATGCCFLAPQRAAHMMASDVAKVQAIPILVTLAAEEGEALTATRERVLAHLRGAMSADAFAAIRTYELLPVVALVATPEIVTSLLTLPDVRSVEVDRSFSRP